MSRPALRLSGSRRRRIGAALALIAVIVVVLIVVLNNGSSSPSNAAANASTATGAATVQRRDLIETDTESGTLSYANPQTVYNRLSGTLTWLPNVGQVVHPGGTLFKVDGAPVTLMDGTTPAYRNLSASDSAGEDILQLNRNLVNLGFNPDGIVIDDEWQPATTAGVELFQASLGETETGVLTLGQIVFLPGDQLVSTVDGTVGSTGGGGGGSSGSNASTSVDPPAPEFVSLHVSSTTTPTTSTPTTSTSTSTSTSTTSSTTSTTTGPTTSTPTTTTHKKHKRNSQSEIAALVQLLRAESEQLRAELQSGHSGSGGDHGSSSGNSGASSSSNGSHHSSSSGGSHHSSSGDSGSGGGASGSSGGSGGNPVAILQTTSTKLVVTVDLSASSQSEAKVGDHVMVQLPDNSLVPGRITAVSPVAQSSNSGSGNGNGGGGGGGGGGGNGNGNGGSSSSTVPVTIAITGHHLGPGLDQAAVSVNFVQQKATNVLSVPVTALLATSGSTYAVQEATPPYKLIPVTTGLFAAGDVQISGPGIYEGLQVSDSQG